LFKTQIMAIVITLSWIIYLAVLAFLDQPERALQYINNIVFGLAILLAGLYFVLTRYLLGRNWSHLIIVLISYFFLYKPIFQEIFLKMTNESYGSIIKFLSISTGTVHFLSVIIGMGFGVLFSRPKPQVKI
jgi:hypothetical protein